MEKRRARRPISVYTTDRADTAVKAFHGQTLGDAWGLLRVLIEYRCTVAKLTQGELAERMGASRQVVVRLEASFGKDKESTSFRPPTMAMLQRYAAALDLEVRFAVIDRAGKAVSPWC